MARSIKTLKRFSHKLPVSLNWFRVVQINSQCRGEKQSKLSSGPHNQPSKNKSNTEPRHEISNNLTY